MNRLLLILTVCVWPQLFLQAQLAGGIHENERQTPYPQEWHTLYINPVDFDTLRGMKDKNGQYLMGSPLQSNENIRPWGLTPCVSAAVTQGKFMVADSRLGATKYKRQDTTLEMFEQDTDNVQKNLITIRTEKRLAFSIDSVNCFVGGDLAIGAASGG